MTTTLVAPVMMGRADRAFDRIKGTAKHAGASRIVVVFAEGDVNVEVPDETFALLQAADRWDLDRETADFRDPAKALAKLAQIINREKAVGMTVQVSTGTGGGTLGMIATLAAVANRVPAVMFSPGRSQDGRTYPESVQTIPASFVLRQPFNATQAKCLRILDGQPNGLPKKDLIQRLVADDAMNAKFGAAVADAPQGEALPDEDKRKRENNRKNAYSRLGQNFLKPLGPNVETYQQDPWDKRRLLVRITPQGRVALATFGASLGVQ